MNKLICALFVMLFSVDYLVVNLKVVPRVVKLLPDAFSLVMMCIVILLAVYNRRINISAKYLYCIAIYFCIMIIGIFLNGVGISTIFIGLRVYLKYLPFFLIPAVYPFSEKQIRYQMTFLLAILIFQFPMSLFQKFIQYPHITHMAAGDLITGTLGLGGAGILSMMLVSCISVLFAFYLKKRISFRNFSLLAISFLAITALSETKAAFFLLPIALATPAFFFQENRSTRVKALFTTCLVGTLLLGVLIPVYDHYSYSDTGIFGFLSNEKQVDSYFNFVRKQKGEYEVGRFYAVKMAFEKLAKDPVQFAFGLGIGNVKRSFERSLSGQYADKAGRYGAKQLVVTNLLWEIGLLGFLVYVLFYWFVFKDALVLMRLDGYYGMLALGWTGVVLIMGAAMFYNNYMEDNTANLLFWYFSGLVASGTARVTALARSVSMNEFLYRRPSSIHATGTRI